MISYLINSSGTNSYDLFFGLAKVKDVELSTKMTANALSLELLQIYAQINSDQMVKIAIWKPTPAMKDMMSEENIEDGLYFLGFGFLPDPEAYVKVENHHGT